MKNILTTLKTLTEFKSVTPDDAGCSKFIKDLLEEIGFTVYIKKFGPEAIEVTNLYAVYGKDAPNICFAGHIDVVPPMDLNLWQHDPFKITIDNEKVYGRGAVDMKGAIACMLEATKEFLTKNPDPNGTISFLLTSDEEGDAKYGTEMMLKYIETLDHLPKIDFCILGEPTNKTQIGDTIKIGRRGSINFQLKIIGKQGHVAYPEKAINPIPLVSKIITHLLSTKLDQGSEFFAPSNLEITAIDTGNDVTNIIPGSVNIKFNIRFNDHHNDQSLVLLIKSIVETHIKNTDYVLQHRCSSNSFIQKLSPRMLEFTNIVQENCQIIPDIETTGGTSDARFIHHITEIVEFGLKSNMAHKIDEYTEISDLQKLYNVYYASLVKYLE